jgi:hypothetical protein
VLEKINYFVEKPDRPSKKNKERERCGKCSQ